MAKLRPEKDGNLGLVQQLVSRMPRFFVISLQKTYSAIPLTKVAAWLHQAPDQTHAFIEDLIVTGALNASIDLRDGPDQEAVLRFFSNRSGGPNGKSEYELHAKLVQQTNRTNQMMEHVKMADRRLVLTKEYVDSFRKRRSNKDEDHTGMDGAAMDTNPEWSSYQDEDLMIDS
jgi:COP9 signalosome complex subunit 3